MDRFVKYYLQSALDLSDGFCRYLIQDRCWGYQEILDVEVLIYDFEEDAEHMLWECIALGDPSIMGRLRYFLAENCRVHFVHRMNDRRVVAETANQLTHYRYQVVLEPSLGFAVQVDVATAAPVLPVTVEPEPDISKELESIKPLLDELVAEQQKKYDAFEATLVKMNDAQKAALYAAKAAKGLFVNAIVDTVDFLKNLPSRYVEALKVEWKIITFPSRATLSAFRSAVTMDTEPLYQEFSDAYRPFAETREQALEYGTIAWLLLSHEESRYMLVDFAERYWKATHPLEKLEVAASSLSDVVMTIILALISCGVGALGRIMVKSQQLSKAAEKLKRLGFLIKKSCNRYILTKNDALSPTDAGDKTRKSTKPTAPDPKDPNEPKQFNSSSNVLYDADVDSHGPKKTVWKGYKDPKEAYDYVNSLKDDTTKISEQHIQGLSKEEAGRLKAEIREWATNEEYPGIDYSKVDNAIDKYTGRELTKKDIDEIKDYVFKDEFLAPKDNAPQELQISYYRQADQWLKLSEGKGCVSEETFLRHELSEMAIKRNGGLEEFGKSIGRNPNFTHADAHMATDEIFDCSKFDDIFIKEIF